MKPRYRIRASSFASLLDCAHRWEAVTLLKMVMPSSMRAHLGTSIHAGTAANDLNKRISEGAVELGIDAFIDAFSNPQYDIDLSDSDISSRQAKELGINLILQYARETKSLDFYSVEMETKPLVIDCGSVEVELTGTMDRSRVVKGSSGFGIDDIKTGKLAVTNGKAKTRGFVAQLGTYELLFEHTTGLRVTEPARIIGLKTSGKPEIGFADIPNAKGQLIGTDGDPGLLEYAQLYLSSGLFPPNPNSQICSPKYCVRWNSCKFKGE